MCCGQTATSQFLFTLPITNLGIVTNRPDLWSDQFNCSAFFLRTRQALPDRHDFHCCGNVRWLTKMSHRRFKNNHSFMCKSFLKCHVSDLSYNSSRVFFFFFCTCGWQQRGMQADETSGSVMSTGGSSVIDSGVVANWSGMQDSLTWTLNKKINRRDTVVLTEGLWLTAEKLKLCEASTKGGMSS